MSEKLKKMFTETTVFMQLGDLISQCIEIEKDIYNLFDKRYSPILLTNNDMVLKIRTNVFNMLYPYYQVKNNNQFDVFKDNIKDIAYVCKGIEDIIHDLLPLVINRDPNLFDNLIRIDEQFIKLIKLSGFKYE